ncbi:unnamed protein product [Phyllotreta striolata]|uniref:mannose-6-phosphate isomerase n=1 Tax=Phyllotreta striolata TaxID=444603 RepID=A0A9N9XSD5_PHYSR|nr:unnamed protein product [Phyllotreta striolata]
MELLCSVQNYDWGKIGLESKVALLSRGNDSKFEICDKTPYAELWMGTHVNGPSIIKETGQHLSAYLEENVEALGRKTAETFHDQLPFLLKVLSINKALSIQIHPSKDKAEELHDKFPEIYKDANHKPELAIALTPFEALCGFRPVQEIKYFLTNIPELQQIITCKDEEDEATFLREAFRSVVMSNKEQTMNTYNAIQERFKEVGYEKSRKLLADVIERLNNDFPNDNGILMVYLLNYIKMNPSESIFLGANEVHAYLYGDCVEIMASSDNVVRAGLTSKFVDVDTLCSMVNYKGENQEAKIFKPFIEDQYTRLYNPPIRDFCIAEFSLPKSLKNYELAKRSSASILIVISGIGKTEHKELKPGVVLFIPSNEVITIVSVEEHLSLFQGFANVS